MLKKIPFFWIAGTLIALVGVGVARGIAPLLEDSHSLYIVVKTVGHLIAFFGIFFIARGISKRD